MKLANEMASIFVTRATCGTNQSEVGARHQTEERIRSRGYTTFSKYHQ